MVPLLFLVPSDFLVEPFFGGPCHVACQPDMSRYIKLALQQPLDRILAGFTAAHGLSLGFKLPALYGFVFFKGPPKITVLLVVPLFNHKKKDTPIYIYILPPLRAQPAA